MAVYCDWCQRKFGNDRALEQHKDDSNHWACDVCNLHLGSYDALMQHYKQDPNHHYCEECDRHFEFEESRMQHMDAKHWYCRQHDRVFNSENGLHSHFRQSLDHRYREDELQGHSVEEHDERGTSTWLCCPLFRYLCCLCVRNENGERQGGSGRMNGARHKVQRVRGYGTVTLIQYSM
ncbi:hypothetical protein V8E53_009943 [Lactarius tabidus]